MYEYIYIYIKERFFCTKGKCRKCSAANDLTRCALRRVENFEKPNDKPRSEIRRARNGNVVRLMAGNRDSALSNVAYGFFVGHHKTTLPYGATFILFGPRLERHGVVGNARACETRTAVTRIRHDKCVATITSAPVDLVLELTYETTCRGRHSVLRPPFCTASAFCPNLFVADPNVIAPVHDDIRLRFPAT